MKEWVNPYTDVNILQCSEAELKFNDSCYFHEISSCRCLMQKNEPRTSIALCCSQTRCHAFQAMHCCLCSCSCHDQLVLHSARFVRMAYVPLQLSVVELGAFHSSKGIDYKSSRHRKLKDVLNMPSKHKLLAAVLCLRCVECSAAAAEKGAANALALQEPNQLRLDFRKAIAL